MKTYCENSVKNFAGSSECPMFVANSSPKNNFCSKAAFLCPENFGLPFLYWTDPLTATVGSLARIKEGDSLFYIYLYNFSSVMPKNHEKRELGNNSTHTPHKQDSRIDLSKNHAQHLENSECISTFVMPNHVAHNSCNFTESDRNKAGILSDKSSLCGLAWFGDFKRGVRPFYILTTNNLFPNMPNHEKDLPTTQDASEANVQPTKQAKSTHKHRDYKARFEVEKQAKNTAYSFILTSGYLDDFSRYSGSTEGTAPHVINIAAIVDECFSDLNNNPL